MRNHTAFKFIAIVLCAAALLGAVGCGVGVFVLTELDLYKKNPTQVYDELVMDHGRWTAHEVGARYASNTLGGCPEDVLDWFNINVHPRFRAPFYGYELKDSEGNVLLSEGSITDSSRVYPGIPISGKYMYLVSMDAESVPTDSVDSMEPEVPCEGISVAASGAQLTKEGEMYQLSALPASEMESDAEHFVEVALMPENTTDALTYTSLDETVVTVDETGLITAVNPGITAVRISCGDVVVDFPVSCLFQMPTEPTEAVTEPVTVPTEAFVYDAFDEETWAEIQNWIEEEWDKESWRADEWEDMQGWVKEYWNRDPWTDDQWAQLKHWIDAEWTKPEEQTEAAETTEATVPETVAPAMPAVNLQELEAESRRKEAELETIPEEILINGRPVSDYDLQIDNFYDFEKKQEMAVKYVWLDMPEYTLDLYLQPGAVNEEATMPLMELLYLGRSWMLPMTAVCLLLFAIFGVYLCCAAGRRPKSDEVRAGGLNRLPLEVYAGLVILAILGVVGVVDLAAEVLIEKNLMLACASVAAAGYLASLITVGFLFALVAQLKMPRWFWLSNSVCGHCWKLCLWLLHQFARLFPFFFRCIKGLWDWLRRFVTRLLRGLAAGGKFLGAKVSQVYAMLPLIWQWLLAGAGLILIPLFFQVMEAGFMLFLFIAVDIALIIYGALAFGTLMDATKRMSQGDLNTKIDDKLLFGCFKNFADNLRALAKVAVVAAQKQLKSERMKTELITNVSHDIKTPLTSIVSYVDLLQKPHTPEEEAQYLEVLNRQSLQLKKLIEDLIEMSKASTGNMSVDIQLVDAVESVNQALGEFSDKLDRVQLSPVFRHSEETVPVMADGKLVWRVLHNLLSNAVKYALPGTRLYIDLMEVEGKVILSMKNVSRDELNVDAEELMERFVRGDDSRNTEGSGLGLNIAKSMMELQKGELQLLVDGDLFKVTLIFPGA